MNEQGTRDWKGIRQVTMRDNFIPTIVNFNTDDISDEVRIQMKKKYLDNPDYDYEKASSSSRIESNQAKQSNESNL